MALYVQRFSGMKTATILAETDSGERIEWTCEARELDAQIAEAQDAGLVVVDVY